MFIDGSQITLLLFRILMFSYICYNLWSSLGLKYISRLKKHCTWYEFIFYWRGSYWYVEDYDNIEDIDKLKEKLFNASPQEFAHPSVHIIIFIKSLQEFLKCLKSLFAQPIIHTSVSENRVFMFVSVDIGHWWRERLCFHEAVKTTI